MAGGTFAAVAAVAYNFGIYLNQKREERIARDVELQAERDALQARIDELTAKLESKGGGL